MGDVVISSQAREDLYERLKTDPAFRERMKDDWRDAMKSVGVDPAPLEGKQLRRDDVVPLDSGAVASSIIIVITGPAAAEEVSVQDRVVFEK